MYSLKRKRNHISSGEGPSEFVGTPPKVARTFGLSILKDTMRLKAEPARFEIGRFFKVTPFGNHDKTPMIETPFHYIGFVMSTSFIPPQPFPPLYIPFGSITTPSKILQFL